MVILRFCLHVVAKHLKRQSGTAQGFILFGQKSFFSVHMHLIHAKRNVHSIHVRKIWTINLLSLSYSWKPSAGLLLASPQTSFGVRLSRIHFSPTHTNEPQRTSAGRLTCELLGMFFTTMNISSKICHHYPKKPSYLLATTPPPPTTEVLIQKKKGVCRSPKKVKYRWRKMGKGRGGEEKEGVGGGW